MRCEKCPPKRKRKTKLKVDIGTLLEKLAQAAGTIVAYGAGVDSTAMVIRLVEMNIPIKAIIFADTGSEVPRTYLYLSLFSDWLESKGYPRINTVKYVPRKNSAKGCKAGVYESLEEQLLRLENLPAVAYGHHTCAIKMKITPSDAWVEAQPWAIEAFSQGKKFIKLIGYEDGEGHRVNRAFKSDFDADKYMLHFPLMEWGLDRAGCEEVIKKAGLPSPGKSACFFCPMRKEGEIRELAKEYPDLFQRALELEARALSSGKITSKDIKGLGGRYFAWKDLDLQIDEAA